MLFTWDEYLQTIQWNNLTITNTSDTKKNQFTSLCRGQGLLQKWIWHAFKMHANTFNLCITDPVLTPAEKSIAQKLLGLLLLLGMSDQSLHIGPRIFLQQPSLFVITLLTLTIFAINGGNPLAPLCSRNRRHHLIPLYTNAGTALVPRNIPPWPSYKMRFKSSLSKQ